jgi:NNP family nitrate/nitrite transporter-like MFS transporter
MHFADFRKAGNGRVLFSAFLYFDVSFMVWVLLGALGTFIAEDLGLSPSQKGLMIALPLLAGAGFRLIMGVLTDYVGSRRTGIACLSFTTVPLLIGFLGAGTIGELYLVGIMLGVAGASFAVALPMASRWYPPEHQGLAMGIAGAGNSGTVIAALIAPRLAEAWGWQAAFGLALIPTIATLIVFLLLASDAPGRPRAAGLGPYLRGLRRQETLGFALLYSVTFGGFVGLSSYLGIFFRDEYQVSKVHAGDLTAICVLAGSAFRPLGGALSDRFGGLPVLTAALVAVCALFVALSAIPPLWLALLLLVVSMGTLGAGNGAVFQMIPQVFGREIGAVTGLVGAAGGVGGFFLPNALGTLKESTGSFGPGFVAFAMLAAIALLFAVAGRARLSGRADGSHVETVPSAWQPNGPAIKEFE